MLYVIKWCLGVSYVVDFCPLLDIYECEYEMSWLSMIKTLSLFYKNNMRPWIFLRRSFMWNLQSSGKVMILEFEVVMVSLFYECGLMVFWVEYMKSSLGKSLSYPLCHWKEALGDLCGMVNVIGLWTRYGTSSCDP